MNATVILSFLPPGIATYLFLCLVGPWPTRLRCNFGLKLGLTLGIGPGAASIVYFLLTEYVQLHGKRYLLVDLLTWCALSLVFFLMLARRSRANDPVATPLPAETSDFTRLVLGCFVVACLCALVGFVFRSLNFPHGGIDTYDFWNLRAKFLYAGGVEWKEAQSVWFVHYPPMLPAIVARAWTFGGGVNSFAPSFIAFLYTFGCILLVFEVVRTAAGTLYASMAGLFLASNVVFLKQGAYQIADVPVAYFVLAALSLLLLTEMDSSSVNQFGSLALPGLCMGFAVWSKNEGIFYSVLFLVAHVLYFRFGLKQRRYWQRFGFLLAGMLSLYLVFALFLAKIGVASYTTSAAQTVGSESVLDRITNTSRYLEIIKASWKSLWYLGGGMALAAVLALIVSGKWMHMRISSFSVKFASLFVLACVCGVLAFHVVSIDSRDLQYFLSSSLFRRLLHFMPSFILIIALAVQDRGRNSSCS